MNFELTDAQRSIQSMVRQFADKEIRPRAADIDRTNEFPRDLYRRMAELGFFGMTLPAEHGGAGADTVAWGIAQEELARVSPTVAGLQMLTKLMVDVIVQNGTAAQQAYVPELLRGDRICAIAQTEPAAGSDVAGLQTTARPTPTGYILNGTKRFITGATVCDLAVVVATVDPGRGRDGITLFLVDLDTPGASRGSKDELMGMRGQGTGELVFSDCHVPKSALLGAEGEGFKRAMVSLGSGRIAIGSQALGIAQAAMDEALVYARQRSAFGQTLASFQAVQFMVADMSSGIEAARLLLRKAAFLKDRGQPIIREAAEAKLFASELAVRVTSDALQIHGAYGYSLDFPVQRFYRDARAYPISEGTSEIQRTIIARQLLK